MSSSASTTGRSVGGELAACAQAKTAVRKSSVARQGEADSGAGVSPAFSEVAPALTDSRARRPGGRRDARPTIPLIVRVEFMGTRPETWAQPTSVRAQEGIYLARRRTSTT